MSSLLIHTGKKKAIRCQEATQPDATHAHPVPFDSVLLTMQSVNDKVYLKVKTFGRRCL